MNSSTYPLPPSTPRLRLVDERATYHAEPVPEGHFTALPDDLIEAIGPHLGDTCGWLYVILDRHANKDGWCDPSEERLATLCHRSTRWVRECLGRLQQAGYITIEHRTTRFGTPATNAYTLPFHRKARTYYAEGMAERSPEGVAERSPELSADKVDTSRPKVEGSMLTAPAQARLAQFRGTYPTHRRGGNSRELATLWATLSDAEQQDAIAGATAWASSPEWAEDNGKYVPGIVKFLTERRWEAAPAAAPTTGNATVDLLRAMGI